MEYKTYECKHKWWFLGATESDFQSTALGAPVELFKKYQCSKCLKERYEKVEKYKENQHRIVSSN